MTQQFGEILEFVVRVVEQNILLGNGLEQRQMAVEFAAIERREFRIFQITASDIRKADEVFEVVVTATGHDGVIKTHLQLGGQEGDHALRGLSVVGKAHRHGFESLFETFTHVVEHAAVELGREIIFGIPGHLDRVGGDLVIVKEAAEDVIQTEADDVIQDDERLATDVGWIRWHRYKTGQIVGWDFNQGVLYQMTILLHLDGQIGVLVFQEGDGVTVFRQQDRADVAQHLVFEVLLDPGLMISRYLVFVDEEDVVTSQRDHQFAVGGVEGFPQQFNLVLNGMQQIFGFWIATMLFVDQHAALYIGDPYLEEFILVIGEDAQESNPFDQRNTLVHGLL